MTCFITVALGGVWNAHEASLGITVNKIKDKEAQISELIHHKSKAKTSEEKQHVTHEINEEYQALKKLYEKFEEEKKHVRYEHPEKGRQIDLEYKSTKEKSMDELKDAGGLSGRLNRLKEKAVRQFHSPNAHGEETKSPQQEVPAEDSQRPRLSL